MMEIIKEVTVKRFNEDLKVGTPVKVTYFPSRPQEEFDYGIVTKNLGNMLVYQAYKNDKVAQFEVESNRIGRGVEIEVGRWQFGEED